MAAMQSASQTLEAAEFEVTCLKPFKIVEVNACFHMDAVYFHEALTWFRASLCTPSTAKNSNTPTFLREPQ